MEIHWWPVNLPHKGSVYSQRLEMQATAAREVDWYMYMYVFMEMHHMYVVMENASRTWWYMMYFHQVIF